MTINRDFIPGYADQTIEARAKRLNSAISEELGDPEWRLKAWRT